MSTLGRNAPTSASGVLNGTYLSSVSYRIYRVIRDHSGSLAERP
jgi:hypothetical protein